MHGVLSHRCLYGGWPVALIRTGEYGRGNPWLTYHKSQGRGLNPTSHYLYSILYIFLIILWKLVSVDLTSHFVSFLYSMYVKCVDVCSVCLLLNVSYIYDFSLHIYKEARLSSLPGKVTY
jgi:hypothetical protein